MTDWQPVPYGDYRWIVADPQLLGGSLAVRGTRLSVCPASMYSKSVRTSTLVPLNVGAFLARCAINCGRSTPDPPSFVVKSKHEERPWT